MILNKFKKLVFQKGSVFEKLKILKELDPLKLGKQDILKIVDYLRKSLKNINLRSEYYGFTGSGGDKHKTINASTLACIIASCDIKICKVGSIGVTSKWGSVDLIKEMGYQFTTKSKKLKYLLKNYGFCYITAGMLGIPYSKELVKARQILYKEKKYDLIKALFGPLFIMNPKKQVVGIYDINLVPIAIKIFKHLKGEGIIVHSYDGIDELSNTSKNLIIEIENGKEKRYELTAEEIGIKRAKPEEIKEYEKLSEQVKCSWDILSGKEKGPKRDFVILNSALLLYLAKRVKTIKEGVKRVEYLVDSGKAYKNFKDLLKYQLNKVSKLK